MKKQAKKKQKANDFDQMVEMLLGYVEHVQGLFPGQFPKLLVLLESIESGEINECSGADLRSILREFTLTGDFGADVERYIGKVKAAHDSAAFAAHLESLIDPNDPITQKARRLVNEYGEHATWTQMEAILSE